MSNILMSCRVFIKLILLSSVLTLVACSQKPGLTKSESTVDKQQLWSLHQSQLSALKQWQMNGRIGLQTEQEGWSATLIWQQQGQDYQIRVIAPLGQGTYQIQQQADRFSLLGPDNELYEAESAETLMQQQLGWSFPVVALRYWVLGLPYPNLAEQSRQLDDNGRLQELQQADWRIRYPSYHQPGVGSLPRKIIVQNSEVRASILAKQWNLAP